MLWNFLGKLLGNYQEITRKRDMINLTIIGGVKMIDAIEDSRIEFKVKLVDDLEETVIAFLNKDGGSIYIGLMIMLMQLD